MFCVGYRLTSTAYLGDQLFRLKIRLQLSQLHVGGGLRLSVLLQGARFVLHLPSLLAEEEHIGLILHQSFVQRLRVLPRRRCG